jgi:hypothetical protein
MRKAGGSGPIDRKRVRRLKIRGESWRIVLARPPENKCAALCCYASRTIYVRPSYKAKLNGVIHEILHACFPDLTEEAVYEAERAMAVGITLAAQLEKKPLRAEY